MPGESSSEMLRSGSLAPPRRRQPPSAPPLAGLASGPPSIGLDDVGRHGELDLGASAGSLELDLHRPGPRLASEPPPEIDAGIELLAPAAISPGDSAVDLPSPVGHASGRKRGEPNAYVADLPAPVQPRSAPAFGRPATPPGATRPAASAPPAARAAPTPSAPVGARPATPSPPASRPSGAAARPTGAPAPSAGTRPTAPPTGGARAPAAPAPLSYDDDLLNPAELDLPTPVADDRLDLPIPVDETGDATRNDQMLTPAGLDVTPAQLGVQPKLVGGGEVAPHDLPALRAERARAGAAAIAPSRSTPSGPAPATPELGAGTRAQPDGERRPAVSRGLLVVAGVLLAVGLAGAGVLYSGILDPEDPEPAALRGGAKKVGNERNERDGKQPDTKATPSGAPAERSPTVLAKLAAHTPTAYAEAVAAAQQSGDVVGAAEASLLLALCYGPNPARLEEAIAALKPYASEPAPFVQRVVGLAALVAGDWARAESMLGADEPRTRLYRGWLRLAQGRLDEATAEADAVLGALPDELGARHLGLAVQAKRDPAAAVPAIQAALERGPHPALSALLATTATEAGQLALARATVDALDPAASDDAGVQAWTHVQKAHVHVAQGDLEAALSAFDRALELVPGAAAVQMDRVRTLVAAKRFNDASATVSALVREHPQDAEAQLLQAEVAIQSGDGDIALQVLEKLATALPKDVRVSVAKGELHAMRLEVDEGRAAFAAARAIDPTDVRAAVGEAVLLADAKRLPDALAVLEAARSEAEARAGGSPDVATLWLAKAKLHAKAGERNAARDALDRALEVAPGHNEAQLRRGVLRLEAGEQTEGRADLVAVFDRTGGYPGLAAPLGRLYVRADEHDALERLVGDRLRGEATPDELLTIGARLRLHQGRTAEARALLELALARHPADWEAHMLLAQVLILEGNAVEALAEIERSRPPDPQPEQMLQRGKILEFNGRHDDVIPEYQRALAIDPELYEARFLYGRMLHYKGGHARAIAELRKVLDAPRAKTAPWYPEVFLNIGIAQAAQGKLEAAIASLKQATDLDPSLGEAWAKAGKLHGDRNAHAAAITALEKAIEVGPEEAYWYVDALMDLGRSQSKAGRAADAKKTLQAFLELAPPDHTSRAEADRLLGEL